MEIEHNGLEDTLKHRMKERPGGFKGWWRRQQNVGAAMILGAYMLVGAGISKWPPPEHQAAVKDLIEEVEQTKIQIREDLERVREDIFRLEQAAITNRYDPGRAEFLNSETNSEPGL